MAGSDAFADPLVWAASVEVLHPFGRRARDAEVRGDGHVPGALDEIPKSVVVALLRAGLRHGHDHRPFPDAAQPLEDIRAVRRRDDNSRGKVQNVRGDSSAIELRARLPGRP